MIVISRDVLTRDIVTNVVQQQDIEVELDL
jgi:hypothetical protein